MKKAVILICVSVIALLIVGVNLFSGGEKDYSNYKNEEGYTEYISDNNAGYEDVPNYNCEDALESSKLAYKYYKNNSRRCGSYIITNYEDGICINRYVGFKLNESSVLNIPEELDGKPVVKIGGYPISETEVVGAFAGNREFTLKLPATIKYIGNYTFMDYSGMVPEDVIDDFTYIKSVEVSEDNPFYASYKGALYTKDKKCLLYEPKLYGGFGISKYTVPDFVERFEPSNGIEDGEITITIGKNVKIINAYIDKGENGYEPDPYLPPELVIRGEKGTVAEKWAKKQYAKFEEIK